jgi:hypothetical protein
MTISEQIVQAIYLSALRQGIEQQKALKAKSVQQDDEDSKAA